MTSRRDSDPDPDPSSGGALLAETLAAEPDFASEHQDLTVGDRDRGGPGHAPEPESPKGYGGADIHRPRPPKKPRGIIQVGAVMALARTPDSAVADAGPVIEPALEPDFKPDFKPDFEPAFEPASALDHPHLTAGGGADRRRRRRRNDDPRY